MKFECEWARPCTETAGPVNVFIGAGPPSSVLVTRLGCQDWALAKFGVSVLKTVARRYFPTVSDGLSSPEHSSVFSHSSASDSTPRFDKARVLMSKSWRHA